MKKISVIIPSYNSSNTISKCIVSVIQTQYPSLEIVVVDDKSTDGSPAIIEELCQKYPDVLKLVYHKENAGPAKARNTGAKNASGDCFFFLDSDTEMLSDTLHLFSKRIEESDAVTGIYHYEPLNHGSAPTYKAMFNYYFFVRKGIIEYEVFDSSRAGIKAEVFHKLGGFNENLSWGMDYENEEFGYRLNKEYKNILDPSIMVKHMFPSLRKLTKIYFLRTTLWMEIFCHRKKFDSGGVTSSETGISSVSFLLALFCIPLVMINPYLVYLSAAFFMVYLVGYLGFFSFVARKKLFFVPAAFLINSYCTVIIASGAFWGLFKVLTRKSDVKQMARNL